MRRTLLVLALLAACTSDPTASPTAAVQFVLDAPLCSSQLPMEFTIDNRRVGADTFRVHLPPDRITSRAFAVSAGNHLLGARVVGGYVWPDTVVAMVEGAVVQRTLSFYCS